MYFIRGAVISLAVFFIVYVTLSLLVGIAWRISRKKRPSSSDAVYGLRLLPLIAALVAVVLFTVPSFLRFEPREGDEPIASAAIALACCGAAVLVLGAVNALRAWLYTARCVALWTGNWRATKQAAGVSVYRTSPPAPLLAVVGLCPPKLLISDCAEQVLNAEELEAAIRHELVHVRRRDNPKKLLLRAFAFPFLGMLERAWLEAAEINADDEATKDEREALDLASALLKISRLNTRVSCRELAMDLVSARDPVEARVERLLVWKSRAPARSRRLPVMLATLFVVTFASMWELAPVHAITEMLIRR